MDSEYAGGEVERCCGVGVLQASRDELDADGRIGNGSARGRSEAKRNTNRKKQRKKAHHPVNGRKISHTSLLEFGFKEYFSMSRPGRDVPDPTAGIGKCSRSIFVLGIQLSPVKMGDFHRFFRRSFGRMLPDRPERLAGENDKIVYHEILNCGG